MALEYEIRYYLEHKALPHALRDNRALLLSSFLRGRGQAAMMGFYARAEEANPGYDRPCSVEQFSTSYREYILDTPPGFSRGKCQIVSKAPKI